MSRRESGERSMTRRDGRGKNVLRSDGDRVSLLEASKILAFLSSLSFVEGHGPSLAFCGGLNLKSGN